MTSGTYEGAVDIVAAIVNEAGTDKPVVFFAEDDIRRMFPADLHHHTRRKADEDAAGPIGAAGGGAGTDNAEVLQEVERLRAEMKAAQADVKAAQMEMIALIQALVKN